MSLFSKKAKEEKNSCSCGGNCGKTANTVGIGEKIESIKVLGAGCKTCHKQYENVKTAVSELGLDIEVEYITDMDKVMEYGVMSMPVIVINERAAAYGKLFDIKAVKELLKG